MGAESCNFERWDRVPALTHKTPSANCVNIGQDSSPVHGTMEHRMQMVCALQKAIAEQPEIKPEVACEGASCSKA